MASGDLPEDRLIRAVVLSRGPQAADRDRANAMLAKLALDLPADLPVAGMARSTLAMSLIRTEPARAAEYAAVDANAPGATPAAISLHATALIAANRLDEAGRQIARLNISSPDDAAAVTLRARLLRARGNGAEAASDLEKVADEKIDGPNGEATGRLIVQALLVELDQPEAALRVARKLAEKHPKAKGVLASVMARKGDRAGAFKLYLETIEQGDPANVRSAARDTLALITRDQFDPESISLAEKVIDAARVKDPKSYDLLAMAGYLRHFQNRYEEEIRIYETALQDKDSGNDIALINNMAWTLSEGLHRPEQALDRINEAIGKAVVVPAQLYDTRGCIYTRMGRLDDAIRDLELAARDRPSGTIYAHLARAYHKAGLKDKFEDARAKAKQTTPPLTPQMLEKADRQELEKLIFED